MGKRNFAIIFIGTFFLFVAICLWGFGCKWRYSCSEINGQNECYDGPLYNYESLPSVFHSVFSWNKSVSSCR